MGEILEFEDIKKKIR